MGSALGGSSQRDRGIRTADIRDFGARPQGGVAAASINRAAIQAAHDYLRDTATGSSGGNVYIPGGDWYVDRPIFFDYSAIGVRGEGPKMTRILGAAASHDLFVFANGRKPHGIALTADHLVDIYTAGPAGTPRLDSTAVTGPNQRWGLRTKADSRITQQGGAFDVGLGDYYKSVRQLTIDFAIDLTNAPGTGHFPSSACVMGLSEHGASSPWEILINNNSFWVKFRTADVGIDAGTIRSFTFYTIPATPGLIRVTIQIDLINAQVAAWVDGQQLTTTNSLASNFTAAANLSFCPNQHCPFGLGANTLLANSVADYSGSAIDCTFFGLKATSGLVYQNLGPGTSQIRADGQTNTDYLRYFKLDGLATVGLFPLTDNPTQVTTDRVITVSAGLCATTGYFLGYTSHALSNATHLVGEVRDLSVYCWQPIYGRAVALGYPLDMWITNCDLYGGANGIGSLNFGANYPLVIRDCHLAGNDAPLYLYGSSSVRIHNLFLDRNYRAGIRALESEIKITGLFTPNYGVSDYSIKMVRGWLDLDQGLFDNEELIGGPTIASIYMSPSTANPVDSSVSLRYVVAGSMGVNASFLVLDDGAPENGSDYKHCSVTMDNVFLNAQQMRSMVRTNGTKWQGEFRVESTVQRPLWVENTAGPSNVVAKHHYFTGPPRDGTWTRNANVLVVSNPAASQFTHWRCVGDGSYGTATPPQWFGMAPIDDGLSLAAYISDHSWWTIAGSPAGSQGFWTNPCHAIGLNAYFGGTMPIPSAQVYLGFCMRPALRWRYTYEVAGNGYARVLVPPSAWTSSTGGVVTNTSDITFPTATGPWTWPGNPEPISSVVLFDSATGANNLAAIDITPFSTTNGTTPSFPAGSLTLGQAAASAQGSFATRVHDVLNNYWIKGQAFTPPSIYLALSTGIANPASSPAEPSGGNYSRLAVSPSSWTLSPNANFGNTGATGTTAVIRNATAMTFPSPTGSWGTVRSVYLMDASSGGNVLAAASLAVPRSIASGDPARSFAPGALWICRS